MQGLLWKMIYAVFGQGIIFGNAIPETEYRRDTEL
jgi:hypothetical protein